MKLDSFYTVGAQMDGNDFRMLYYPNLIVKQDVWLLEWNDPFYRFDVLGKEYVLCDGEIDIQIGQNIKQLKIKYPISFEKGIGQNGGKFSIPLGKLDKSSGLLKQMERKLYIVYNAEEIIMELGIE